MLPQFPYARVRAAHDIVGLWDGVRPSISSRSARVRAPSRSISSWRSSPGERRGACVLPRNRAQRGHESGLPAKLPATNRPGPARRLEDRHRRPGGLPGRVRYYLKHEAANVIVFSYSARRCYRPSLQRLIADAVLQSRVDAIYILDATAEHGSTKVYYMPLDCRSPEDFRNIALTGNWHSHTLWHEPFEPVEHYAVSRAWCALRRLTPPHA